MTTLDTTKAETVIERAPLLLSFPDHDLTIQLDPDTLQELGYVPELDAASHCGHDLEEVREEGRYQAIGDFDIATASTLEEWHNENHAGVFRFCYEAPCLETRRAVDAA